LSPQVPPIGRFFKRQIGVDRVTKRAYSLECKEILKTLQLGNEVSVVGYKRKPLPPVEKRWLTVVEICAITPFSKSMVYKLLYDGVLHRVRFKGTSKVLVSADEVQKYIADALVES
jgi:excisionase family DNA binding protein